MPKIFFADYPTQQMACLGVMKLLSVVVVRPKHWPTEWAFLKPSKHTLYMEVPRLS